jgi:hypothetical protein
MRRPGLTSPTMKRIAGGLLVALLLVAPASAAAIPPPAPLMENRWPPREVSLPLETTLEPSPLRFFCPGYEREAPAAGVSWRDYGWRISTSSATESEGLLSLAHIVAYGGATPMPTDENECRGAPQPNALAPGDYYWQVSRPKQLGPGVEVGQVWTFSVGPSPACRFARRSAHKLERRIEVDRKNLRAARVKDLKRRARIALQNDQLALIATDRNRKFFCDAGARRVPAA